MAVLMNTWQMMDDDDGFPMWWRGQWSIELTTDGLYLLANRRERGWQEFITLQAAQQAADELEAV
jgi:hypothetical protein